MEGPSKAEIAFEDRKDGSCGVSYVVQEPGRCSHLVRTGLPQPPSSILADQWALGLPSAVAPSPFSRSELSPDPMSFPGAEAGWGKCVPALESADQPPSSGDYEVSIKFNDEHIPDSPFVVPVASLSDDARRLTVTSLQVCAGVRVGELRDRQKSRTAGPQCGLRLEPLLQCVQHGSRPLGEPVCLPVNASASAPCPVCAFHKRCLPVLPERGHCLSPPSSNDFMRMSSEN